MVLRSAERKRILPVMREEVTINYYDYKETGGNDMFKSKLTKALALGLCMSVLYTGAAYAQSGEGSSTSFGGTIEVNTASLEKQREIDQILFIDRIKEIDAKGIKVVYTVATGENVEVGVASLTDEQEDYLYSILGKDQVKIVKAEETMLYTTMAVEPAVASDEVKIDNGNIPVSDKAELYTSMVEPRTAEGAEEAPDGKVYKGSDAVVTDDAEDTILENPEVIFYTTADGVAEPGQEAELVYATGESADLLRNGATDDSNDAGKGLSTPLTILLITGGAVVIGGGAVAINKKKTMK